MNDAAPPLLDVDGLALSLARFDGTARILNGVDLVVFPGERVALVGESGCGKTLTARMIMGLFDERGASVEGRIRFDDDDLLALDARGWDRLRGRRLTMIFQDPVAALNPVFTIADQLATVILRGGQAHTRVEARDLARPALAAVAIADPDRVLDSYPFQLSGGLNQRVLIAMALVNRPALVLADEPGTALDVTVQAQTLALMHNLTDASGAAVLLITHNLGVVRNFAQRVYVMYAGSIVEEAPVAELFAAPRHPYTQALFAAVPRLTGEGLPVGIEGGVPDYRVPPPGCRFHPRCPHARPQCHQPPPVIEVAPGHKVACVLFGEKRDG
ncbi:MAG: ABC transporter ATP-binding protein [Proteobacteria bacterium]|nr:ABC transporter ATP-binding protein [Pseudomonadota bacterium]